MGRRKLIKCNFFYYLVSLVLAIALALHYSLPTNIFAEQTEGDRILASKFDFPKPKKIPAVKEIVFEDFLGSEVCGECHIEKYNLWKKSTHGRAGGKPDKERVLAKFDGTTLEFKDARVTLAVKNKTDYIFTVEKENEAVQVFQVETTIGRGHMMGGGSQTFFSKFSDGTIRFLPFDYVRTENVWFCDTRNGRGWVPINRQLSLDECKNWPPYVVIGAENVFSEKTCQQCHGSQITTKYDKEKKKFVTRYATLQINCESCHGPGKKHVEIAKSGRIHLVDDIGMVSLSTLSKDESLKICFQCHSLKMPFEHTDYLPGKKLEDHYSLIVPPLNQPDIFYPDGRIKTFAYQQNHQNSDCYLNGSMKCVDCHEPHSQGYRDIYGVELTDKMDNRQCTGCHASKKTKSEAHSHHKKGSKGDICVNCHMPFLQQKSFGNRLTFARSDHTIPIPRPEFDASLGIENSCIKCHKNKTNRFLQETIEQWYGKIKPHKSIVSALFNSNSFKDRNTAADQFLDEKMNYPVAQVNGLSFFIKTFLTPDMPYLEPKIIEKLKRLSTASQVDLQALALMALHLSKGNVSEIHKFLLNKIDGLKTNERTIRMRWARTLVDMGFYYKERGDLISAEKSFSKAIEIYPDDVSSYNNLGLLLFEQGEVKKAESFFDETLKMFPENHSANLQAGLFCMMKNDINRATQLFNKSLELFPLQAEAINNMGNVKWMRGELDEAVRYYIKSINLNPANREAQINIGMILSQQNKHKEALKHYLISLDTKPDDYLAHNLAGISLKKIGRLDEAILQFYESIRLNPNNPDPHINLGNIFNEQHNQEKANYHFNRAQKLR